MLSLWIAASLAAEPIGQRVTPSEEIRTVEWNCRGSTALAKIKIGGRDPRTASGKYWMKIELAQLEVNGKPSSPESAERVKAGLHELYSVGKILGRCVSPDRPELIVEGHVPKASGYDASHFRVELH